MQSQHIRPIAQALLVTFLWSTSFIIIKKGLVEIPPLTYAGLRYVLAALCFLPVVMRPKYINEVRNLTAAQFKKLLLLGFVFYTATQGAQFIGLSLLPSATVSLLLNFTPLVVAVIALFLLQEKPTKQQWAGSALFLLGVGFYFYPVSFPGDVWLGLGVMGFGILANSWSAILGREINRNKDISPVIITLISMAAGAIILLTAGFALNGLPEISLKTWLYLLWLAGVNTAFAFTLWNLTLRSLTAMESSIINGTMLIQIGLLAWFFLDEKITVIKGTGMALAAAGIILVQIRKSKS
ncbi:MAG: DMT family transporter [Ignavibacteriales bacterium]|nr:DMT family transporter [Ignavibacteriales bacterium]